MKNILVMRDSAAVGDCVLTLPLLETLGEAFGRKHVHVCGSETMKTLSRPFAQVIETPPRMWSLYGESPHEEVVEFLEKFDAVVCFGENGRLRDIVGEKAIPLNVVPPKGTHAGEYYADTVASSLGLRIRHVIPRYRPPHHIVQETNILLERISEGKHLIAFAPGSGSRCKNWPEERFREAIRNAAADYTVLRIIGPAEAGEEAPPDVSKNADGIIQVRNLPLERLAAVLSHCDVFVGNDSGISHLAAAVGTPTVCVFGPTDPVKWAPRSERCCIVTPQCACAPCGLERARECTHRRCLACVDMNEVTAAIRMLLRASAMDALAPARPIPDLGGIENIPVG